MNATKWVGNTKFKEGALFIRIVSTVVWFIFMLKIVCQFPQRFILGFVISNETKTFQH